MLEEKGGVRGNTKEVCTMVPWPRLSSPNYIVYKESGTDKIGITTGYRAMKFKEKALKGVIGGCL